MKKLLIKLSLLSAFAFASAPSYAYMNNGVWINDMKSLFARNQAIIMAINIRTFNANDKDKNLGKSKLDSIRTGAVLEEAAEEESETVSE